MAERISPTRELAKFALRASYADLPQEVVYHTKRLICEDIACTLGGYHTERTRIIMDFVRNLGGNPQSTILGSGEKTSMTNAALVNSSMGFAMDFDDYFMMDGHPGIFTFHAVLSPAEMRKATGKQLIEAFALAFDIAVRIGHAQEAFLKVEAGKLRPILVSGFGWKTFGAAAGAGKILGLNEQQMVYAFGLAAQLAPVPSFNKWQSPVNSLPLSKAEFGQIAQAGLKAALLAKHGLTAPHSMLDGKRGFWRMNGAEECDFDFMLNQMGERWFITDASHKPWPSCGMTHHPLTAFVKIIEENDISAEEIDKVVVKGSLMYHPIFNVTQPSNPINMQYSIGHVFANAAFRVPPGPAWQDPAKSQDPKYVEFREKVSIDLEGLNTLEIAEEQLAQGRPHNMRKVPTQVIVTAKGKTFSETVEYQKGSPDFPMTDEDLKEKFRNNAYGVVKASNIEKAMELIYDLENVDDITEIIELLVL